MVQSIDVEPTVSVIIPAYNCDRYIVQAIESVLEQKDCSCEILVIDDGSTDSTEEILTAYGDRIRYIKQKKPGSCSSKKQRHSNG